MKFLTYSSPELSCEIGKLFSRWLSNSSYSQMLHNPKYIYLVTPNDFPEVFSELHNCMYLLKSIIDYNRIYFSKQYFQVYNQIRPSMYKPFPFTKEMQYFQHIAVTDLNKLFAETTWFIFAIMETWKGHIFWMEKALAFSLLTLFLFCL